MTFYLKYRSQTLDELDLEGVRETLKNVVASGNIPHAFLFSGPKGSGKTSAARILAKIVNCTGKSKVPPCNKCEQCISITRGSNLDVIELDAASHRGIDDIRSLRDAVKLAPAGASKKIYIIDEAHMLTTEASNALLKTLEEPPDHVVFILATTNPEKLIDTIRSRAFEVHFQKATNNEIVRSLVRVVGGEKIDIKMDALEAVARAANGSFRDATKILEQLVGQSSGLDKRNVEDFLFKIKAFDINKFFVLLSKRNVKEALLAVEFAYSQGFGMEELSTLVESKLKSELLAIYGIGKAEIGLFSKDDILILISLFDEVAGGLKTALIEQLPVEVAVVKWGMEEIKNPVSLASRRSGPAGREELPHFAKASRGERIKSGEDSDNKTEKHDAEKLAISHQPRPHRLVKHGGQALVIDPAPEGFSKGISTEIWQNILEQARLINASIGALLRAARPIGYDGKSLTLGVFYKFHKERLEEVRQKQMLEELVARVLGTQVRIYCRLTEPPIKLSKSEEKMDTLKAENTVLAPLDAVLTEGEDDGIIKVAEEIFGN